MIKGRELIKSVEPIIRDAGKVIMSYFGNARGRPKREGNGIGVVTQADIASEKLLMDRLHELLPEACFWAEESGKLGEGDYCWVIDPLDGTTNFSRSIPHFCLSIALTHHDVPVFGMVYQPVIDELYAAVAGEGAFLNGTRLKLKKTSVDTKRMLMMCFPYGHSAYLHKLLAKIKDDEQPYAVRLFGAAALDLCYLAAGNFDGVFLHEIAWWDIAAGMVLVAEAGGIITDFAGKPIGPGFTTLLAARPGMHEQLLEIAQV